MLCWLLSPSFSDCKSGFIPNNAPKKIIFLKRYKIWFRQIQLLRICSTCQFFLEKIRLLEGSNNINRRLKYFRFKCAKLQKKSNLEIGKRGWTVVKVMLQICCRCLCGCVLLAVGLNPTHTTFYCQQNRGALSWFRQTLRKLSLKNWEELPNKVTNLQTNMLAVFKWALCGCVVLAVGLIGARLEPGWGHGWFVDCADDDNGDEDGGGGVSYY